MSEPEFSSDNTYSTTSQSSSGSDVATPTEYHPTFPNREFDYGDGDHITTSPEETEKYLGDLRNQSGKTKHIFRWPREIAPFVANDAGKKRRKKFPEDQLDLLNRIRDASSTTPKKFWDEVLKQFPPRFLAREVLHHLCTIKPMQQPSDTAHYREVMEKADACRRVGAAAAWQPNIEMSIDLPDEALLEAVRIYGNSNLGFGSLPVNISSALKEAGLYFLAVNRNKRIVPQCWQAAADKAGITYAKVHPVGLKASASASHKAKSNRDSHHNSREDMTNTNKRHQDVAIISGKVNDLEDMLNNDRKELRALKREFSGLLDRIEKLKQNQRVEIAQLSETWAMYDAKWSREELGMRTRLRLLEDKVARRSNDVHKSSRNKDQPAPASRRSSHRPRQIFEDSSGDDLAPAAAQMPEDARSPSYVGFSRKRMRSASFDDREHAQ